MSESTPTGLPLEGLRVVEFTHMVMGPTCGMILADLGAEVIKVEPPGGDKTRSLPGLGIRRFDACLGGIGGCPHAPGASGNVATEDLAYMLASMGIETGLDFNALIELRGRLAKWLEGETLHGSLWRAGLPKTLRREEVAA